MATCLKRMSADVLAGVLAMLVAAKGAPTDEDVAAKLRHNIPSGLPPGPLPGSRIDDHAPQPQSSHVSNLAAINPKNLANHFVLDTARLDLDNDGCIAGEAELDLFKYHVATALPKDTDNLLRAHSIVHRSDVNKDGRICWCDFISIYLHDRNQAIDDKHRAAPFLVVLDNDSGMFTRLDQDGDGKLQGPELESLVHQFSSCLMEDQARLIVAAITGLNTKDNALSRDEFAEFLGLQKNDESEQQKASTTNTTSAQSGEMQGVFLTTAPPVEHTDSVQNVP